jgi:hypothetical protein
MLMHVGGDGRFQLVDCAANVQNVQNVQERGFPASLTLHAY